MGNSFLNFETHPDGKTKIYDVSLKSDKIISWKVNANDWIVRIDNRTLLVPGHIFETLFNVKEQEII